MFHRDRRTSVTRPVALAVVLLLLSPLIVLGCRTQVRRGGAGPAGRPEPASVKRFRFFNTSKLKTVKNKLKLYESPNANGSGAAVTYAHGAAVPKMGVVNKGRTVSAGMTKYILVEAGLENGKTASVANAIPAGAKYITHVWAHLDFDAAAGKTRICLTGQYVAGDNSLQQLDATHDHEK